MLTEVFSFTSIVDELVLAASLGILAPIAAWAGGKIVERQRKQRALKRVQANPYLKVGAKFNRIMTPDGTTLVGEGLISFIGLGIMEILNKDGNHLMSFSLVEWESLHPVMVLDKKQEKSK